MRFDTEDVATGLFDELVEVLQKYNTSLLTPTVIGVLEMLKADLLLRIALGKDEDDDS